MILTSSSPHHHHLCTHSHSLDHSHPLITYSLPSPLTHSHLLGGSLTHPLISARRKPRLCVNCEEVSGGSPFSMVPAYHVTNPIGPSEPCNRRHFWAPEA
eukprot:2023087-Pyramimonas_sp.AAC.1